MFCCSIKWQIKTFCSQRQSSFARRRSFWLHSRKHNSQHHQHQEEEYCQCNNDQYLEHQLELQSLKSLRPTTLTKISTYKTKLVADDKAQCMHSTSVQKAIAQGSQLEKQLLQYFASSSQRLSSLHPHSSSEQPEPSVNSLLPITGTALAWQMHTAFYADAITRPMLFPQHVQQIHTMHHTTPSQEENCFGVQSTNGKTHTSDSSIISSCSHESSLSSERIVNLNAILRSALHRTNTSGATYATLRESGEYRMLDSRFTNKPEQEKDLTNAEVPFIKLSNDLQRIWDNVLMAYTSVQSLYKMFSLLRESSSSSQLVTIIPEQAFRPNCVVFLILYAHQRNSCAVTSHMIDIANMIKELVKVNNSTCCRKESNKHCNENSDTITNEICTNGTNINCSTHSTVCADNVLKVITIVIGFEPPPLSLMPSTESLHNTHARMYQNELAKGQKTKHTCERKEKNKRTINTMHCEAEEVDDTLCYSHAGAYTMNGILHIIQSLTSPHGNKDVRERLQTEEKQDVLQKRVFILSESWLTPRTLTALHSLPYVQIEHEQVVCEKANESKSTNFENSSGTYTNANNYNIHKHIKLSNKSNYSDNTIIEVIPSVISNSLSEVEKNAVARYTFCRMIK